MGLYRPYGTGPRPGRRPWRVRIHHLREMKERGEKFAMLTAYEQYAAQTFDEARIPILLVGDSASNNVYGNETSLPVTVDEARPAGARRDPVGPPRARGGGPAVRLLPGISRAGLPTAVQFMKEANAHAVKARGWRRDGPAGAKLTESGIPVMAHIGFTPQSEHALGGYQVQGRGDAAARPRAGQGDGVGGRVRAGDGDGARRHRSGGPRTLSIPTIGIGAGPDCDGQVLVWQDAFGLRTGGWPSSSSSTPTCEVLQAAQDYAADVAAGTFPGPEHTFDETSARDEQHHREPHRDYGAGSHTARTRWRVNHRVASTNSATQNSGSTTLFRNPGNAIADQP